MTESEIKEINHIAESLSEIAHFQRSGLLKDLSDHLNDIISNTVRTDQPEIKGLYVVAFCAGDADRMFLNKYELIRIGNGEKELILVIAQYDGSFFIINNLKVNVRNAESWILICSYSDMTRFFNKG